MQKKIYFWPSLDCGLYASGHAVAIAESFGRAVEMLVQDYPDTPKNLLLSHFQFFSTMQKNFDPQKNISSFVDELYQKSRSLTDEEAFWVRKMILSRAKPFCDMQK